MSSTPTRQDVVELDEARKNRRERLAEKFDSAKSHLAPATLATKIGREQKEKLAAAGRKAGAFSRDHKYAIGSGVAAILAAAAGLYFYNRSRKSGLEGDSTADIDQPSDAELNAAVAEADPITGVPASAAAGSAP